MKNKTCRGIFCQNFDKEFTCNNCKKNYCKCCIVLGDDKKLYCIDCFAGLYIMDLFGITKINIKKNNKTNKNIEYSRGVVNNEKKTII